MSQSFDDIEITRKMQQLENTVKTFRAEVNMKMAIVEQILSNRNEQFQVQKELLNREQFLYQTVMAHWKNIADLAANGLSLQFSGAGGDEPIMTESSLDDTRNTASLNASLGKRPSSAKARRERSKRVQQAKRLRADDCEDEEDFREGAEQDDNVDRVKIDTEDNMLLQPSSPWDTGNSDMDIPGDDDDGHVAGDYDSKGMEKKVYLNYYSPGPFKKGDRCSTNPIWKHFLREEGGQSSLCKPCENQGSQTIIKTKRGSTFNLSRHLKRHHNHIYDQILEETVCPQQEGVSLVRTQMGTIAVKIMSEHNQTPLKTGDI